MNHTPSKHGVYFLELELENVRCFGPKVKIDLRDPKDPSKPARWTVLVGENGVGKTTVLRSLFILRRHASNWLFKTKRKTLIVHSSEYSHSIYGWQVGRSDFEAEMSVQLGHSENILNSSKSLGSDFRIQFKPGTDADGISYWGRRRIRIDDLELAFEAFGYGASRHMSVKAIEDNTMANVSTTLFRENEELTNASELFHQTYITSQKEGDGRLHETLKSIILSVLPNVTEIRTAKGSGLTWRAEVETPYGWVWIHDLSLGYKTMVAWIVDFASKLFLLYPNSPNPLAEPAVCLVDEIDLHMHPTWQRKIMGFLTSTFPNTQFIVTAHSPLMVQAAAEANVVLLTREGDHVVVNNEPQIVKNWSVDQILASVFGISGRTEATEKNMERRRELLGQSARTPEEQLELERLEVDLEGYSSLKSSEELEAASLIREFADIIKRKKQSPADDQNP
ncbi:MAG: AAA family ATPase [Bacteroidia bacterium]